jgi:hypothetical protein
LAGLVLDELVQDKHTHAPIVVSNTDWAIALFRAQERAEGIIVGDRSRMELVRKRKITDPVSQQTFVLWGDASALTARFLEGTNTLLVHPEVFKVDRQRFPALWGACDPNQGAHWSSLPHHAFFTALGGTPTAPAFTPQQQGPLAAWADLRWVDATATQTVAGMVEACACWIGTRTHQWPEQWLATVQARAVASDGTLSDPVVQWGARVVGGRMVDSAHQATALGALGAWLAAPLSPLAGWAGVAHGQPMAIGDPTGGTIVPFFARPSDLSAHAKLAKAEAFQQALGGFLSA